MFLRPGVRGQMGCLSPVLHVQGPLLAELPAQEASSSHRKKGHRFIVTRAIQRPHNLFC